MKKFLPAIICLCAVMHVHASTLYWVGPLNGKWSDVKNWSLTGTPGSGGAGVPGSADAAVFDFSHTSLGTSKINMDVSPVVVSALRVETKTAVTLYTSASTILVVNTQFLLAGSLTDSTVENVKFDVMLGGSTNSILPPAGGSQAYWIFSGRVPVNFGAGAYFIMTPNSLLTVGKAGNIVFRNNTAPIISSKSTLKFAAGSHYILENNLDATIPDATWDGNLYTDPMTFVAPASEVQINGNAKSIKHSAGTYYANLRVNLSGLSSDIDLSLPDGITIHDSLIIQNTNNHTLTLLSAAGLFSKVEAKIGGALNPSIGYPLGGLFINGSNSKVALARAASSASATYKLTVVRFNQTGGNFSLQDGDASYTGSSTLAVETDIIESAGSFVTNCASTNAKFVVQMNGPFNVGTPSGPVFPGQTISMSSGSIDNGKNMVTLKMAQTPFTYTSTGLQYSSPLGVKLTQSLVVGKLELNGGPLFVQNSGVVIISNPSPSAVQITGANSYVNGPVRRWIQYAGPVMFPTGKGTSLDFHLDTIVVIPSSSVSSLYQAEYFSTGYADQNVQFPFKAVSSNKYWNVTKFLGADAQVKLILNSAVPGAIASNKLVVAHYTDGKWTNEQGTTLSPGNASAGSVQSKVLSSFGVFTFGCTNYFTIPSSSPSTRGAAMHSTAAEKNTDLISLAPTIVTSSTTLQIDARAEGKLEMLITDLTGRTWRKQVISVRAGSSITTLDLHDLPAGVYQLSGRMSTGTNTVTRFIKQ